MNSHLTVWNLLKELEILKSIICEKPYGIEILLQLYLFEGRKASSSKSYLQKKV